MLSKLMSPNCFLILSRSSSENVRLNVKFSSVILAGIIMLFSSSSADLVSLSGLRSLQQIFSSSIFICWITRDGGRLSCFGKEDGSNLINGAVSLPVPIHIIPLLSQYIEFLHTVDIG